jgi:hypothetical protein
LINNDTDNLSTIKHLVIPDCQAKSGVSINHLNAIGNYIVDQKPDVIIQLGDFGDMHSLSSYDRGTVAGENARYQKDLDAAYTAMEVLMNPIRKFNENRKQAKKSQYYPRMVLTCGNHENRINRHVNQYPILEKYLSIQDLKYESFGWEVHNFLEVVEIDGINYSHYFPRNASGRIVQTHSGAPSAMAQVRREMQSCTAGHLQGLDFYIHQTALRRIYGIICGSCYLHEEDYLSPQGTKYWRGIIVKHEVFQGEYDPMFVSLKYLLKNFWDGVKYTA